MYSSWGCEQLLHLGLLDDLAPGTSPPRESARSATTPMLWVITMIDVPSRTRRAMSAQQIRGSLPARSTSRAVVGSSATISRRSSTSACAITMRCFWPPENSWRVLLLTRSAAFGIPTYSRTRRPPLDLLALVDLRGARGCPPRAATRSGTPGSSHSKPPGRSSRPPRRADRTQLAAGTDPPCCLAANYDCSTPRRSQASAVSGSRPMHRASRHRLTRPGFTDDREHLPRMRPRV